MPALSRRRAGPTRRPLPGTRVEGERIAAMLGVRPCWTRRPGERSRRSARRASSTWPPTASSSRTSNDPDSDWRDCPSSGVGPAGRARSRTRCCARACCWPGPTPGATAAAARGGRGRPADRRGRHRHGPARHRAGRALGLRDRAGRGPASARASSACGGPSSWPGPGRW